MNGTIEIRYTSENGVAEIAFARAEKKNAITQAMYAALADNLLAADADDDVRSVLITAEGDTFTAGNDIADFQNEPPAGDEPPVRRFLLAIAGLKKPIVAAVNGAAIGVGTTLLLHCDLVVASTRARFLLPFVDLGIVPEAASSLLLPRLIGRHRAAEMILLGESIDAQTAFTFGLANRVVEPEALRTTAMDFARRLAAKAPTALRLSKDLLRDGPQDVAGRMAVEGEHFAAQLRSPEAREAFKAFFEKRAPDFSKAT